MLLSAIFAWCTVILEGGRIGLLHNESARMRSVALYGTLLPRHKAVRLLSISLGRKSDREGLAPRVGSLGGSGATTWGHGLFPPVTTRHHLLLAPREWLQLQAGTSSHLMTKQEGRQVSFLAHFLPAIREVSRAEPGHVTFLSHWEGCPPFLDTSCSSIRADQVVQVCSLSTLRNKAPRIFS